MGKKKFDNFALYLLFFANFIYAVKNGFSWLFYVSAFLVGLSLILDIVEVLREEKSKYTTQIRNSRKNYVRFPLDLKPDVLEKFKEKCAANGTTPTTEIKKFISEYCEK